MAHQKLKAKKCKYRKCRSEFQPATEWQKFCSIKHRSAEQYQKQAETVRRAQRILDAQEKLAVA